MRKVIKLAATNLYDGIADRVGWFVVNIYPRTPPIGRVALSLKIGRKRRLVTGMIEAIPYSERSGLRY